MDAYHKHSQPASPRKVSNTSPRVASQATSTGKSAGNVLPALYCRTVHKEDLCLLQEYCTENSLQTATHN